MDGGVPEDWYICCASWWRNIFGAQRDPKWRASTSWIIICANFVGYGFHAAVPCPAADGRFGGAKIYLKREDLLHTGAHKINNAMGRFYWPNAWANLIIAETGAAARRGHGHGGSYVWFRMRGLHGHDCDRQRLGVFRMRMLGAEVVPVEAPQTLKEAVNEAMRDWVTNAQHALHPRHGLWSSIRTR